MTELELIQLFEKYLQGEMDINEKISFEKLIWENSDLKEKFSEHSKFLGTLTGYGRRKRLKYLMEETQREIDLSSSKKRSITNSSFTWAIAASLGGIIIITASFYFGFLYSDNKSEYTYLETSKKLKTIEAKQDAILRNLDSDKKMPVEAELAGTGFLISNKGYVITNYHLIRNADSVLLYNNEQTPFRAEVAATNIGYDLALLKFSPSIVVSKLLIPYSFRKKVAEPGEEVFTIGYPREDMVYGEGSISSSSGFQGDSLAYQISIPVNPGNSGGPLLDDSGNITGIISGKQTMTEGTGFAIKAAYIQDFIIQSFEKEDIKINTKNSISWMNRKDKVKKLKPFVFQIKVYQ